MAYLPELVLAAVLLAGLMPPAGADPAPAQPAGSPAWAAVPDAQADGLPGRTDLAHAGIATWPGDQRLDRVLRGWVFTVPMPAAAVPVQAAKPLPAPPDSASLFLCAVGTLGAWQIGRSARRLNLSEVPAWLHTGGPAQIGHAVIYDPFDIHLQPLLGPRTVPAAPGPPRPGVRMELPLVPGPCQGFLTAAAPRGPPRAA